MKRCLFTAIIVFLFHFFSFSQAGTLDNSFGINGKVVTNLTYIDDEANSIAITTDNKIIVAGNADTLKNAVCLVRYLNNGSIDSSFGNNGKVFSNFNNFYPAEQGAMVLQSDGKILVGGGYEDIDNIYYFGLIRFNVNGSIDTNFASKGFFKERFVGVIKSILFQNDGKFLVAGNSWLQRFKNSGILDSTFASNGTAHYNDDAGGLPVSLALQKNKIILSTTFNDQILIERFKSNGLVDSIFGNSNPGTSTIKFPSSFPSSSAASSCITLSDNKILVSGKNFIEGDTYFALAKLDSLGFLDKSFGSQGVRTALLDSSYPFRVNISTSLSVQADNKIILAGYTNDTTYDFGILRYNPNGILDSSFGLNGFAVTDFFSSNDFSFATTLQKDGKIILAGYTKELLQTSHNDFALARYNNDAILPVNFTSFTAAKDNNLVSLNWNVCNEINNKGFYIQRSNVANNFADIDFTSSKEFNRACNNYSYTDTKPFAGNNFYRLKQVDNDGKVFFSKIVNINFESLLIAISPNPVKNILTVKGLGNNNSILYIVNANGKTIDISQTSNNEFNWNTQSLSAGNYFLVVYQNNKKVSSIKFIKQSQ